MDRAAFLIGETDRISCMLNPEGLTVRRHAGVRPQHSLSGPVTGSSRHDDPLLYTGGGRTELQLDLLFDVHLPGSTVQSTDVRDLTRPLWQLAENSNRDDRYGTPPTARFVWGKAWNMLGVVTSVAERFEQFTAAGEPQRSWLRLRFVRIDEPVPAPGAEADPAAAAAVAALLADLPETVPVEALDSAEITAVHTLQGDPAAGETLPVIVHDSGLDPALWPLVAWFNDIDDPLRLLAGTLIRIPGLAALQRWLP